MAELTEGPGPAGADNPGGAVTAAGEAPDWGRLLDAAGIIAGVLLIVIVADIWTDGRLISRHLHRRGGEEGQTGDNPAG